MKKELKELIDNAPVVKSGLFSDFMFVSNGKYNGFWGKNGYNNIIVLARNNVNDGEWCKLCDSVDMVTIFDFAERASLNLDIPNKYGVPRIWFNKPIQIDYPVPTSSLFGYMKERTQNVK